MIPASRPDFAALDLASPVVTEPTPPASMELLAYVEWFSRAALTAPYAQAALMFDGQSSTALRSRRISATVAPGTVRGRYYATHYGYGSGGQYDTSVSTSTGGLTNYSKSPSPTQGVAHYLPSTQQGGTVAVQLSGNDTGTANGDHSYLQLPEALSPQHIEIEIWAVSGWALHVPKEGQTHDLEAI